MMVCSGMKVMPVRRKVSIAITQKCLNKNNKRLYHRREKVSCLDDLAKVVEASAEPNMAELVGREDGTVYVPTYGWSSYLAPHFRKVPQLKTYHHITISCEAPGVARLKLAADSEEEQLELLRDEWTPAATELPPVLPPPGLTLERQRYLYHHIRDYCTESTKDTVCPRPQQPTGRSECALETSESE